MTGKPKISTSRRQVLPDIDLPQTRFRIDCNIEGKSLHRLVYSPMLYILFSTIQGVNDKKWFYLHLHSIALKTFLLSPLKCTLIYQLSFSRGKSINLYKFCNQTKYVREKQKQICGLLFFIHSVVYNFKESTKLKKFC